MRKGSIGINCWISITQLAEITLVVRRLGSTSTKPGTIVRQLIEAILPSLTSQMKIKVESTSHAVEIIRREGIQSIQQKINPSIIKALADEALEDADFKNWKAVNYQARLELEQLLEQHLDE